MLIGMYIYFFVSQLNPKYERLFKHSPLDSFKISSDVSFASKAIGKNILANIMQRISEKCDLS